MYEIETLADLVRAVSDHKTGGYEVEFDIQTRQERYRAGDGFFLAIKVSSTMPYSPNNIDPDINGEWWFWDDNTVMQVL